MYKICLAFTMLLLFSCNHATVNNNQEEHQDHANGSPGIDHTLFSNTKEFFITHEKLFAGQETEFLVHMTDLESYSPCVMGQVRLITNGISQVSGPPIEPGIFSLHFVPDRAGEFEVQLSLEEEESKENVTFTIEVHSTGEDSHEENDDTHSMAEPENGEINFLKEQAWESDFMVSEVSLHPVSNVILTSGELMPAPGKIHKVVAPASGIISFADKNLVQGSDVKEGQLLFTISGKSLSGDNIDLQRRQAANHLEKSRREFLRHESLFTQGAISEKQFEESRSIYISDSLYYQNLAAGTSEEGLRVYAPVSGSLHLLEIDEGSFVERGRNLVTLSSDKILLLRADLPQQFHQVAPLISGANFRPAYSGETWSISDFNGRHLSTGRSVAENNHYLPVHFELENDGRLLEGAFAEIYLKTNVKSENPVIPLSAMLEEQGNHFVYVQVSGESFTKRAVETGANDGRQVEIIKGLDTGERIVTRGVILVKAASVVTSVAGHGHAH